MLSLFHYCPVCGSAHFLKHDARSKRCADCGFIYYLNASAATVAVVFDKDDRLLVVRRANDPAKGTLDLPGGFLEPGEDAVSGLLRELYEETHAIGRVERFLFSLPNRYEFSGFIVPTVDLFFTCSLCNDAPLTPADDASEILWISRSELRPTDFGLASVRKGVERLLIIEPDD